MRIAILLIVAWSIAACAHAAPPRFLGPPIKRGDVVDTTCGADADCAIKNVGNCCGAYPACVNRASPTFPDRVQAECTNIGVAGICGYPVIEGCVCTEGRCSNRTSTQAPIR